VSIVESGGNGVRKKEKEKEKEKVEGKKEKKERLKEEGGGRWGTGSLRLWRG
jgi:hypothetical protein